MEKLMNSYETLFIIDARLADEEIKALTAKFTDLIAAHGTVGEVSEWGKRRLAYPINDEPEGVYTVINFTSDPNFPAELDRVYKITDGVLRSIIVAKEEEKAKTEAK